MQKATINPKQGINAKSHRKENHFLQSFTAIVFENGEFKTPVDLRIYGTNAKNYACLWANTKTQYCNGSGSAGGYGYHRSSAAAQAAINAAGIELSEPIDGRGDGAISVAVKAIAEAMGYTNVFVHNAHP